MKKIKSFFYPCFLCGRDNSKNKNSISINAFFRFLNSFCRSDLEYTVCSKCGLIYLSKRPSSVFYENYYKNAPSEILPTVLKANNKKKDFILEFSDKKKIKNILDIGCGTGELLNAFSSADTNCIGIDLSKVSCDFILKKNSKIKVFNKPLNSCLKNFSKDYFDLITLIHLLEHIERPENFFQSLNKLKFNKCYMEVPVLNKYTTTRTFFFAYGHIAYYCRATIYALLKKSGFKVLKIVEGANSMKVLFEKDRRIFSEGFLNYNKNRIVQKNIQIINEKRLELDERMQKLNIFAEEVKNKLKNGRKILIFGFGSNCCRILEVARDYRKNIIGIVDKNPALQNNKILKNIMIYSPDMVENLECDEKIFTY
ncbi:MAG: class I SAM-dependent methyltransferase [Candidatus Muiribacteriota bacterium]